MDREIIINYVNNIEDKDINAFLTKNNIILNNEEYEFLKAIIKEKYNDILDENTYLFKLIKDSINKDAYYKLLNIFNKYKILIKK